MTHMYRTLKYSKETQAKLVAWYDLDFSKGSTKESQPLAQCKTLQVAQWANNPILPTT